MSFRDRIKLLRLALGIRAPGILQDLASLETALRQVERTLAKQEKRLAALPKPVASLKTAVRQVERTVAEQEKRLAALPSSVASLEIAMRQVERTVAEQEERIAASPKSIAPALAFELRRVARGARINSEHLLGSIYGEGDQAAERAGSLLNRHEAQVYSQNGEDGILLEIFRQVGATNKFFIEIGAGGLENNTNNLFFNYGWAGIWVDLSAAAMNSLNRFMEHNFPRRTKDATIMVESVQPWNINELISAHCPFPEPDLLTIDVDGNDAHLLSAIEAVRPRVMVVEYNASFGLEPISVPFRENFNRSEGHSFYHGASVSALARIANAKGYALVGCDSEGVNAFFVRRDVLGPLRELEPEQAFMAQRRRTLKFDAQQQWEAVKSFLYSSVTLDGVLQPPLPHAGGSETPKAAKRNGDVVPGVFVERKPRKKSKTADS